MSELEFSIDGESATPIVGWSLAWVDRSAGIARLTDGEASISCVVEGAGSDGDEVAEGAALLTIEAMKMQNEVRSPRAGRVVAVTVAAGQTVSAGASLLRIE